MLRERLRVWRSDATASAETAASHTAGASQPANGAAAPATITPVASPDARLLGSAPTKIRQTNAAASRHLSGAAVRSVWAVVVIGGSSRRAVQLRPRALKD